MMFDSTDEGLIHPLLIFCPPSLFSFLSGQRFYSFARKKWGAMFGFRIRALCTAPLNIGLYVGRGEKNIKRNVKYLKIVAKEDKYSINEIQNPLVMRLTHYFFVSPHPIHRQRNTNAYTHTGQEEIMVLKMEIIIAHSQCR